jgi:hypothetical protein
VRDSVGCVKDLNNSQAFIDRCITNARYQENGSLTLLQSRKAGRMKVARRFNRVPATRGFRVVGWRTAGMLQESATVPAGDD